MNFRSPHSETHESISKSLEYITPGPGDLPFFTRRIIVTGTAGDLAIMMADGRTLTIPAVPTWFPLDIAAQRILSAGTTATGILVLY